MINDFTDITTLAKKTFPKVFVSRVVLYKSLAPADVIREIKFSLGVNIISTTQPKIDSTDVDVIGHSVGKTTLCRFIRYILGETSFSNEGSSKLIADKFPDGWVGAEIYVNQKKYSVLRPINLKSVMSKVGVQANPCRNF